MPRPFVSLLALVASLAIASLLPGLALADASPAPTSSASAGDADRESAPSKDAGSITGDVTSVDYRANRFSVRSNGTTFDIVVLPSTDFQGRTGSFQGFTDLKKGAHVRVMLSRHANTYSAQIINLL